MQRELESIVRKDTQERIKKEGRTREVGITVKLERWGQWKRSYVVGLGFPSSGMEQRLIDNKGEVYGDGCTGSGKSLETRSKVQFKGDEESMRIDSLVKRLKNKHPKEMYVLSLLFVMGWSKRQVGKESGLSRHSVGSYLNRAKQLVYVGLDL